MVTHQVRIHQISLVPGITIGYNPTRVMSDDPNIIEAIRDLVNSTIDLMAELLPLEKATDLTTDTVCRGGSVVIHRIMSGINVVACVVEYHNL